MSVDLEVVLGKPFRLEALVGEARRVLTELLGGVVPGSAVAVPARWRDGVVVGQERELDGELQAGVVGRVPQIRCARRRGLRVPHDDQP